MAAIARLTRLFSRNCSPFQSHGSFSFSTSSVYKQSVISELLMNKYQFSPETVSRVAHVLISIKNLQQSDSILSFLKENGFSRNQLGEVVKCYPQLLTSSLEKTIKPKIIFFQDIGFSASDIAHLITKHPSLLHRSVKNRISPSLSLLKRLLGSSVDVAKVLRRCGWFLSLDLDKSLVPNIKFMKSCGIPMLYITRQICFYPRFLLQKPDNLKKCVYKVDDMGVHRSSKAFIYAVQVFSSMSNGAWERKLKAFKNLGFSEDDTLKVFRSAPVVFSISENKIKKVKEVLLETGKYKMSCIINSPTSLMYSVENRYIPRLQVLGVLEKRGLIKKWPGLSTLTQINDNKFFEIFVAPYDIGEIFVPKKSLSGKRGMELLVVKDVKATII